MLHCQELMDAFEILADRSQVAPGSGAIGVLETLAKMEKLTAEIGICPHCLEGMSEELAGDKAPDVAFGIMLGVIAANNAAQKTEDDGDKQRERDNVIATNQIASNPDQA